VQLFVDVRAPWRQYLTNYTPGAFELILVPGDSGTEATFQYGKLKCGDIRKIASRKTDKGYIIEMDLHFHTGEVEDPDWVARREVRVGALVNDSDDPNGADRKSAIGFWNTAADAGEDCASLTTFITEN
jgi:hypothetical protein